MSLNCATAVPASHSATRGWRVWLAWLLCSLVLVLAIGGVALGLAVQHGGYGYLLGFAYGLSCTFIGTLIITRRAHNLVGWLLLLAGMGVTSGCTVLEYGLYGAVVHPGSLPWPRLVAWTATLLLPLGTGVLAAVLPLVFPDGHLLSPRWRWSAGLALAVIALLIGVNMVRPGNIQGMAGLDNPFALRVLAPWVTLTTALFNLSGVAVFAVCAASVVVRYRRVQGDQRLQMKWFAYAVSIWIITILLSGIVEPLDPILFRIADALVLLALLFIPISVGIAVLRYRLYAIDMLINRTLVYGLLTTGAVGGYVLVVTGLGALLPVQQSPISGLVATGLIAVLFQPLRVRVQQAINHLLYGERDEPYTALMRLGTRLEATLAPDAVLPTLVQTVAETLRLPYVAIALHRNASSQEHALIAASYGIPTDATATNMLHAVSLTYHGETLGQLLLAPRRGAAFTAADQRLLRELARQAGAAVQAAQLGTALHARMDDLRRSRERLVTAQEEERRRIQRDLHDGLGPVLASMRFRLEACLDQAQASAPELAAELERLDELVGQASTDMRRLVHDLRPPALDQIGLVGALHQHVARVRRETGLHVQLDAAVTSQLSAASEVTIYRAVQEALVNVHKHARATRVAIRLTRLGGALLLHVQDDGIGGALEGRHAQSGHGLAGMRERAELLHGTLVLRSRPESGTTLELYLPMHEEHNDDKYNDG